MRLLTDEEIDRCQDNMDLADILACEHAIAKAQAELTESDTLKKVGAYISEHRLAYRGTPQQMSVMTDQALQSLLRGEKPEGL